MKFTAHIRLLRRRRISGAVPVLTTIMLITTLVVSFCKDGKDSVNAGLWFLVVCVRCEVLCRELLMMGIAVPETC
jgi:hypothetical protein